MDTREYSIPVISTEKDEDFRNVIRHSVANGKGANIVFILGTTGEFYALPQDFKKHKIIAAANEIAELKESIEHPVKPLELAIGITGKSLDETVELAQYGEEQLKSYNIPGYLVLLAGYLVKDSKGRFTRRGIPKIVSEVLDNTDDTRIILYTHSGMTGKKNMRTATWKRLARHTRITYLKVSATDKKRIKNYQRGAHGNAKVIIGDADLALGMQSDGAVVGDGNILPVAWQIALRRDHSTDAFGGHLADQLLELREEYIENAVGSFHYLLYGKGIISSPETFDPRNEVTEDLQQKLDKLLENQRFNQLYEWNSK